MFKGRNFYPCLSERYKENQESSPFKKPRKRKFSSRKRYSKVYNAAKELSKMRTEKMSLNCQNSLKE